MADRFRPEQIHAALGPAFYDPVRPAAFPESHLRFRNDRWAARIGLDGLDEADWIAPLRPLRAAAGRPRPSRWRCATTATSSGCTTPTSATAAASSSRRPATSSTAGCSTSAPRARGPTPWSRGGDGRLTLKGGVREVLATEMLEALGVYTSKTFSLIETGEALTRGDEPSPTRSSVLVRLSHSHIRIGSFQRLAALGETEALRRLVDHSIAHYWPDAAAAADPVAAFFDAVVGAVATLGAEWFAAGFVHGVLNTDNVSITGESFDYGPWRFLDRYEPGLHRRLLRPDRPLLLRPPARGAELEPRAARRMPDPALLPGRDRAAVREFRRPLPGRADPPDLRPPRPAPRRRRRRRALMHRFWGAMQETAPPFQQVFLDLLGGGAPSGCAPARSARSTRPRLGRGHRRPRGPCRAPRLPPPSPGRRRPAARTW